MRIPGQFSVLLSLWRLHCLSFSSARLHLGHVAPTQCGWESWVCCHKKWHILPGTLPTYQLLSFSTLPGSSWKKPSRVGSSTYLANWFVNFPFQLRLRGVKGTREITFLPERRNCVPEAHITEHKGGQVCLSQPNKILTLISKLKGFELLGWGPSEDCSPRPGLLNL